MDRFLLTIDGISAWVGKAFAWCIMIMTFGVSYEVFVRKFLSSPTSWAFDISYIMYGTLFMMAGAYTLSRDGHVRGDVIYRLLPIRAQATIELILYFLFFYPAVLTLIYAGTDYALESWSYNMGSGEVSVMSPAGVPISPFKTVMPVAAAFLLLQGFAETARCVICLKTGAWPQRRHDVEEMETILLHAQEDEVRLHRDEPASAGAPGAGRGDAT
ncbi:MAG: TRAP transporter small permease subunit [Rhodospirillales bacterium]|nr:MAG: TRAP transporter small permease subunit [Rhodospirillales bacterium]